ncbi:MAG: DNA methyltransferase [Deltaproteobacteria bacterium]|jgi:Eco57I restriction-modification methylase
MKIDAAAARKCLKSYEFSTLFREHLGWDNHHARLDIPVGDDTVCLTAIAQKRGFVAFVCSMIPDRPTRLKIDHKVTQSVREHFVIYADHQSGRQIWHWVRREPGKPLASRDHRFDVNQSGDPLIQRLNQIAVSMDEEDGITVVDVAGRVRAALDVDKITKKFYDRFKAEHAAFFKHVQGIKTASDLAWYTSLTLNRLMFVYFIQKKGFLDGDTDYLKNRLAMVQQASGKDRFQTFYRYFLLRLFHDGLGKSPSDRKLDLAMEKLLGRVPFLNGGFFEVHQLEVRYPQIDIPDNAFENLFAFFDQYCWHLDDRPLRVDNEINPDVVGYIFEKYINQKQMGAYYTKEDITEYISKNTLIPFLFDAAEKKCPIAFKSDTFLWKLLQEEPDRYIYPAVKHGIIRVDGSLIPENDLPDFVQTGMHNPKSRMHDKRYNLHQASSGDPLRLVTETWREYVNRRSRCLEIREKLKNGAVHHINDLITLNLDIWQFARDAIVTSEGPELLRAFWQAIEKVTVLDPTCGSGAFLFAALRILETLYSDCLERMARFIEDIEGKPHHPKQFSDFKDVLSQIGKHPSERYFVLKSIIINNLYGVDIMAEAVEICKLRLFLKLVAQVETAEQIEPLPDMDFNIRAGNTLIGYATEDQARKAFSEKIDGKQKQTTLPFGEIVDAYQQFEDNLLIAEKTFKQFRVQQTTHGGKVTGQDKQTLRNRLKILDDELDCYLASEYGIVASSFKSKSSYEMALSKWKASHQPFHWFVEFYGIMHGGGFDVVIGNPPYVEISNISGQYSIQNLELIDTGNLFALCLEKFAELLRAKGRIGVIVPISSISTQRMLPLMRLLKNKFSPLYISNFAVRPAKLFVGVDMNLTIVVAQRSVAISSPTVFSTSYNRWGEHSRPALFQMLAYTDGFLEEKISSFPKLGNLLERRIFAGLADYSNFTRLRGDPTESELVYCHSGGRYFRKCIRDQLSNEYKELRLNKGTSSAVICLLSSSLYYWFWIGISDCYHVTKRDIDVMPVPESLFGDASMKRLADNFLDDLYKHAESRVRNRADGSVRKEINFRVGESKPIIDQIDQVLAQHYGFSDEELDFIINYDIKYRMGRNDGKLEEEE